MACLTPKTPASGMSLGIIPVDRDIRDILQTLFNEVKALGYEVKSLRKEIVQRNHSAAADNNIVQTEEKDLYENFPKVANMEDFNLNERKFISNNVHEDIKFRSKLVGNKPL